MAKEKIQIWQRGVSNDDIFLMMSAAYAHEARDWHALEVTVAEIILERIFSFSRKKLKIEILKVGIKLFLFFDGLGQIIMRTSPCFLEFDNV